MVKTVIFDMYETLITHYQTPLYFSVEMAQDLHIDPVKFQEIWRPTNDERTTGKISFEEIINRITKENGIEDEALIQSVIQKRIDTKKDLFHHLHPHIIPMLEGLRKKGIKIGLISNCFSEESKIIKESILYPYFDVVCLSYDCHLMKPDLKIFELCLQQLNVDASECIYFGDGGSHELYSATKIGMQAMQACYYNYSRDVNFVPIYDPIEILKYCVK